MLSVRGDTRDLRELAGNIRRLAGRHGKMLLNLRLAEEARTQIIMGFEQERDPYGMAWKKQVSRPGGQTLRDTGRLMNSLRPVADERGFTISTNVKYAGTHQYGDYITPKRAKALRFTFQGKTLFRRAVTIPRRQFLPEGTFGPIWTKAFIREADKTLRQIMGVK